MTTPLLRQGWRPAETFTSRLMTLRRHLHMTQEEFADHCDLPRVTLARWELGHMPRNAHLVARQVAEATGCDLGWLLYGATEAPERESGPRRRRKGGDTPERLLTRRNNATYSGVSRDITLVTAA